VIAGSPRNSSRTSLESSYWW